MHVFTLKKLEILKTKIEVCVLYKHKTSYVDAFCKTLPKGQKDSIIASFYATLESYANNQILPKTKFKKLKRPKNDKIPDYEIKYGKYRLYLFTTENHKIVVSGGMKKNQLKDIRRLRRIKKEYFESQKS